MYKFETETSARTFIAIDCRRKKDQVGAHQLLHNRYWNSSGLIDDQELSLSEFSIVLGSYVLNGLPVVTVNVHPHYCIVELRVCALQNLIILVLLVIQGIEASEEEIEYTGQVLWGRGCNEDIAETVHNGTGKGDT